MQGMTQKSFLRRRGFEPETNEEKFDAIYDREQEIINGIE